jgi:hypothetical protein
MHFTAAAAAVTDLPEKDDGEELQNCDITDKN